MRRRLRIDIAGRVQGVGFRPTVYGLAGEFALAGWVANASSGVVVEIEGEDAALDGFLAALPRRLPPHARIDSLVAGELPCNGARDFVIAASLRRAGAVTLVAPDLATCPQCLAEMADPADRRHLYPFINCTHCGPRFSIIADLPYDRGRTAMRGFALCPACAGEYGDPADRRFHAEPVACPRCGPQLALWDAGGKTLQRRGEALAAAAAALANGAIVAVKGIGGFHLMADAADAAAVRTLRRRKRRPGKAFAVMFADLAAVRRCCAVSQAEAELLTASAAPIVLLRRRADAAIAAPVAPGSPLLGALLAYAPLHHLLLAAVGRPLVATSGNLTDEPIVTDEAEAPQRLAGIADLFLVHDRPILRPLDDSVVRMAAGRPLMLRRARGYAPLPLPLPAGDGSCVLALGAALKATVTLAVGGHGFVSQHLGDLDSVASRLAYRAAAADLPRLLAAPPARLAHELHPDVGATQRDLAPGLPAVAVQHHLAHCASVMAENGVAGPVLGIVWDGTGWGGDGSVWGGEFLRVDGRGWRRLAHLRQFSLPGGDAAAREPRRAALGVLRALDPALLRADLPPLRAFAAGEAALLVAAIERRLNAPLCSSAGRLFDAVAALLDLSQIASHEGEAAMALEFLAEGGDGADPYPLTLSDAEEVWQLDWRPAVTALLADRAAGAPPCDMAARFHAGLAAAMVTVARRAGLGDVAQAGGGFENRLLLEGAVTRLRDAGFRVHWNRELPPNDGSISYGQAAWALTGGWSGG